MIFLFDNLVKIPVMKQYILSTLRMHLTEIKTFLIMVQVNLYKIHYRKTCVCGTDGLESSSLETKFFASVFLLQLTEMVLVDSVQKGLYCYVFQIEINSFFTFMSFLCLISQFYTVFTTVGLT